MSNKTTEAKVFACSQSEDLAQQIAAKYGVKLGNVITSTYSDGEFQPSFEESVRGTRVFIIGSTNPGPKNLMEMLLMLDAAKRASARPLHALFPYFCWARPYRKDQPSVPMSAKLVAKMLETASDTPIIPLCSTAAHTQRCF